MHTLVRHIEECVFAPEMNGYDVVLSFQYFTAVRNLKKKSFAGFFSRWATHTALFLKDCSQPDLNGIVLLVPDCIS